MCTTRVKRTTLPRPTSGIFREWRSPSARNWNRKEAGMNERTRPPLGERLKAGMEETLAWARGEGESRVTIVDGEGRRQGPELLTAAETWERVAERPEA